MVVVITLIVDCSPEVCKSIVEAPNVDLSSVVICLVEGILMVENLTDEAVEGDSGIIIVVRSLVMCKVIFDVE